ncbi:hypothetical protein FACS1894200_04840 [Spirochaetia bacterium]|nr:hypothetical protein FACS1894200_04840 [Spirochaetia bacterium]
MKLRHTVDKAIAYLRSLGQESIKNADYIEKVIAYLEKNKEFIPCYAIMEAKTAY